MSRQRKAVKTKKLGLCKCSEVAACRDCPFIGDGYLRLCTSFKLEETIAAGLEKTKHQLLPNTYKRFLKALENEVETNE